jgi:hypothetical protein
MAKKIVFPILRKLFDTLKLCEECLTRSDRLEISLQFQGQILPLAILQSAEKKEISIHSFLPEVDFRCLI